MRIRYSQQLFLRLATVLLSCIPLSAPLAQDASEAAAFAAVDTSFGYQVTPNQIYLRADGKDLTLDLYSPRPPKSDGSKILVFFHGGGWVGGSKERSALAVLPYLQQGWMVANVQYRLGGEALAPAAVEDARCAVWWLKRNAERLNIDPNRMVLSGRSAGGHLALITGMAPASAGLDARCPSRNGQSGTGRALVVPEELEVAAIINWAGITDVNDLISGSNAVSYAVAWLGGRADRQATAKRVSPLNYVRKGLPPILTLHGDQDRVVPYAHAQRLHKALVRKGVANELHTLVGREHFVDFTQAEVRDAFGRIREFLTKHVPFEP